MIKLNETKVKTKPASTTSSVKETPNAPQVKQQPQATKIKNSESLKGKLKSIEDVRNKINELSNKAETLSNSLKESKLTSAQKQNIDQLLQTITRCHLPTDQINVALRNLITIESSLKAIQASTALIKNPDANDAPLIKSLKEFAATDLQESKTALKTLANPMQQVFDATRGKLGSFQEKIEAGMPPELKRFLNAFPGVKIILYRLLGFKIKNPAKGSPEAQRPEINNIKRLKYSKDLMQKIAKSKDKLKFVYFGNENVSAFKNQQLPFDLKAKNAADQLLSIHKHVVTPGQSLHIIGDNEKSPNSIFLETLIKTLKVKKTKGDPLKLTYQQLISSLQKAGLKPKGELLKSFNFDAAKTLLSKIPCTTLTQDKAESKAKDKTEEKADAKTATKVNAPAKS